MQKLLQPGLRKVTMLGAPMFGLLAVGCVALFVGKITAAEWSSFSVQVLSWAGGIFVLGNAAEHAAKRAGNGQ